MSSLPILTDLKNLFSPEQTQACAFSTYLCGKRLVQFYILLAGAVTAKQGWNWCGKIWVIFRFL